MTLEEARKLAGHHGDARLRQFQRWRTEFTKDMPLQEELRYWFLDPEDFDTLSEVEQKYLLGEAASIVLAQRGDEQSLAERRRKRLARETLLRRRREEVDRLTNQRNRARHAMGESPFPDDSPQKRGMHREIEEIERALADAKKRLKEAERLPDE